MNFNSPLFLLCSLAGVLLVAGSLYLVWKGIIDFKSGQGVTEMEVGGAKIKTPVPAIVMFVLGVLMVVFPVYKSPDLCPDPGFHKRKPLEIVELRGTVSDAAARVEVDAVVDVQQAKASDNISLSVPYVENRRYVIRYLDRSGGELSREDFILQPGEKLHTLNGIELQGPTPPAPTVAKLEQSESSATVAGFNK
jgi:hypothetical protein